MAKIGLGISYVIKDAAASAIKEGSLFEIELEEKIISRYLGLLTHKDVPLTRAAQEFVNLVTNSTYST